MFNLDIKLNDHARAVLIMLAIMFAVSISLVTSKWDGHLFPQENC